MVITVIEIYDYVRIQLAMGKRMGRKETGEQVGAGWIKTFKTYDNRNRLEL
jgi:hypothetical protein